MSAPSSSWNPADFEMGSKRAAKDSIEIVMAKLADKSFSMKKYSDPIKVHLKQGQSQPLPPHTTAEMEADWLAAIKAAKTGDRASS